MKKKFLRFGAFCLIVITLCAAFIFQYLTVEKNNHANAILVMASFRHEKGELK